MTIKSSSTSWIINTRYAQGKQKMFKVPVARPFEVAVNPLFLRCLRVSSFWQRAEFAVLARRECVTCTHAASSSLSAPRVYICIFYKFSSSKKNNERARHVLCEHPYVALLQRARWCTHECAHLRFIFYCTIKRPSNNNNSHVTARCTHANAALGRYGINGWVSRRRCLKDEPTTRN